MDVQAGKGLVMDAAILRHRVRVARGWGQFAARVRLSDIVAAIR